MNRRILIVDDEEGIRLIFLKALEQAGYEVRAADSASEQRTPPQWLEATFRDAAARQVLGFRLRRR